MVTQRDPDMPFPSRREYQRKLREAEAAMHDAPTGKQAVPSEPDVTNTAQGDPVVPIVPSHTSVPEHHDIDAAELAAEQAAFDAAARAVEEAHQREEYAEQEAVRGVEPLTPEGEKSPGEDSFLLEETRPYPPALLNERYSSIPRAPHSAPPAAVFWEETPSTPASDTDVSAQLPPNHDRAPALSPASVGTQQPEAPVNPTEIFSTLDTTSAVLQSSSVPDETTGMRSRRLESERSKAKKRRLWRRVRTVITFLFVIALISGAVWLAWNQIAGNASVENADDYAGAGHGEVQVTVFQGESGADIGNKLVEAGVVKSTAAFIRAFEANQASSSIWPGTYSLRLEMSAADAVAGLLDEANRSDNTVTVIPGQTLNQVMKKIVEITEMSEADVSAALADPKALGLPDVAGGKVEGWLAPGSYEVAADETAQSLLSQMIAARVKQLDNLKVPEADRQSLLIKASILEREVNIDEYLPKVARVIENRLADPAGETVGKLQMDSTVLYGVGKTGGIPTAEDLANDNPYNTYLHPGLPAAPIAQPAIEAIEAMMKPAEGPWLYFVTVDLDTGETRFASTKAEHDANKAVLDAYCAAQPSKCEQ